MTEMTKQQEIEHAFWSGFNMGRDTKNGENTDISESDFFDEIIMLREHIARTIEASEKTVRDDFGDKLIHVDEAASIARNR